MKNELGVVIDELCTGNLSSGRRYEKLTSTENLYSVRLNRAYRFVFLLYPDRRTALHLSRSAPTTKRTPAHWADAARSGTASGPTPSPDSTTARAPDQR